MAPLTPPPGLSPEYWATWQPGPGETPLESLVHDGAEQWIGGWDGVGLYEANNKVPAYQTLSLHLTSHRLILLPAPDPASTDPPPAALATHLAHVRQTEFYTGFIRSSPKISLVLGPPPPPPTTPPSTTPHSDTQGWTCRVCGFVNARHGLAHAPQCGLCGMAWAQAAAPTVPSAQDADGTGAGGGSTAAQVACPACTFLNSALLPACEICLTPLPRAPRPGPGPAADSSPARKRETVRLSFRKGGDKVAYQKLKSVLGDKAWERETDAHRGGRGTGERGAAAATARSGAGIDGILQQMDWSARAQDEHMQSAFADLDALMLRAGEMVRLAQSLNAKLSQQQAAAGGQPTEEETTMIRTSLVQLGLAAPALTKEMVRTEQAYYAGLAKELGGLLTGRPGRHPPDGLMVGHSARAVLALDEVWGLWMRARGVALLPPSTLIDTLPYLPEHTTPPIHSLTLPSSLVVLHTPPHSTPAVLERTLHRLAPAPPTPEHTDAVAAEEKSFSALEFAALESLPIGLATEFIALMEAQGGLVRDEQAGQANGGVRWYRDILGRGGG